MAVAPVLLDPEDARYPVDWFFDWVYHLHGHGRSVRSRTVAELLRPYLSERSARPGAGNDA